MPLVILIIPGAFLMFGFGYHLASVTSRAMRPQIQSAIASPASALRHALGFGVLLSHAEKFCPAELRNATQTSCGASRT